MSSYGLYQTLNSKIPKSDLKATQKIELNDFIENSTYEQKEAILLLIYEYARINEDYVYDPVSINIPFGGKVQSNDVHFELKKIPIHLRWILWKFTQIGQKTEN